MPIPAPPRDWRDALGAALRERRLDAGLSQERLAHRTARTWREQSVHRNTIGNLEHGRTNFSIDLFVDVVNEIDGDMAAVVVRAGELLAEADTGSIREEPDPDRGPLHLPGARTGRARQRRLEH